MRERTDRKLAEMTRCMLKDSQMEKKLWVEAKMTATNIRNVLSHTAHPETIQEEPKLGTHEDMLIMFG